MGQGYELQCRCGNRITLLTGVGFLYFKTCEDLYQEVKNGSWGKNWTSFIKKYPDGLFDATLEVYQCPMCNNLSNENVGNYYIADCDVDDFELENHAYWKRFGKTYPNKKVRRHICSKCKKTMKRINFDRDSLICPKCGKKVPIGPIENMFLWD